MLRKHKGGRDIILFMGANARVGGVRSDAVGGVDAVKEDLAGEELHEVLRDHALCLPSTLAGTPGDGRGDCTWCSESG